jgi:hypothetical protein
MALPAEKEMEYREEDLDERFRMPNQVRQRLLVNHDVAKGIGMNPIDDSNISCVPLTLRPHKKVGSDPYTHEYNLEGC